MLDCHSEFPSFCCFKKRYPYCVREIFAFYEDKLDAYVLVFFEHHEWVSIDAPPHIQVCVSF